mgnify:CR=1 FL=1
MPYNAHYLQRSEIQRDGNPHDFRSVYTLKEALAGKTFMPEIMSLTLQLEEFMLRRYEIRNNKMSGEVEYRDKSLLRFTFSPFTREVRNSICTEAHKEVETSGIKTSNDMFYSDNIPTFFPIEEYLGHLPNGMAKIISGSLPNAYLATISDGQTTSTDGSSVW